MTVTAIVILALYLALELRNAGYVILEIVDIVAWVFMWEAADLFFLERNVLKLEQLRSSRLYAAEITFGETVKSASAKSAVSVSGSGGFVVYHSRFGLISVREDRE